LIGSINISGEIPEDVNPTCLDISDKEKLIGIGTSDGTVLIYSLTNFKKVMRTNEHKSAIATLRIYRDHPLSFISSDIQGNTLKTSIQKELLMTRNESYWIFKGTAMVTNILILNRDVKSFVQFNPNGDEEIVVAISTLDSVLIVMLEPIVRVLYKARRPPGIDEYSHPHISWINAVFNSKRKKTNPYLLVGWGSLVFLLELNLVGTNLFFVSVGHYPLDTDSTIMHVGWISESLVFLIDDQNSIIIVSTENFFVGEYDSNTPYMPRSASRASMIGELTFCP